MLLDIAVRVRLERMSFVAISFCVLSLLFGACRLLELSLAGPQWMVINSGLASIPCKRVEILPVLHVVGHDKLLLTLPYLSNPLLIGTDSNMDYAGI